jgi:hypothetical protein
MTLDIISVGNPLNPVPESARRWSGQFGLVILYRETARVERTISLLDFLTVPATISNRL